MSERERVRCRIQKGYGKGITRLGDATAVILNVKLPAMRREFLLVVCLLVPAISVAQECQPTDKAEPESNFAYIRAEIKSLQWLRLAILESKKIPSSTPPGDPERAKKAELRNTLAMGLAKFYDCATQYVEPYGESKNKAIHESANGLMAAIRSSKEVNQNVLAELQQLDKAQSKEDIDPEAAKRLEDLTSQENDARTAIQAGVKVSTFGIVRLKDPEDPQSDPVAFLITAKQRDELLAEVKQLAKKKPEETTYIDTCAEILLSLLNKKLPTLPN